MLHEPLPPWATQPLLPLTSDGLKMIRDHSMSRYSFYADAHNDYKQYLTCKTGKLYVRFVLACKLESAAILRLDEKMFAAATKKQEEMLAQIFECLEEDPSSVVLKEDKDGPEFIFPSELALNEPKIVNICGRQVLLKVVEPIGEIAKPNTTSRPKVATAADVFDSMHKGDQSVFLAGEICKKHRARIELVTKSLQKMQYWKCSKTSGKIVDSRDGVIVAN